MGVIFSGGKLTRTAGPSARGPEAARHQDLAVAKLSSDASMFVKDSPEDSSVG
jgi:hypothetical protein